MTGLHDCGKMVITAVLICVEITVISHDLSVGFGDKSFVFASASMLCNIAANVQIIASN